MYYRDLSGQKFGRLTVVSYSHTPAKSTSHWVCRCDCGNEVVKASALLRRGTVKSCGCLKRDFPNHVTHGGSRTPEYNVWAMMLRRCYEPKARTYKDYGGRGITVCGRWRDFANFWADMGPRPSPAHQVERLDNDGPYSPENCRWATRSEQARNRRTTLLIDCDGESLPLCVWAERFGLPAKVVSQRLRRGWNVEKSLTTPTNA